MPSIGLNVGLKALLTAQSALETVGHNISNANTPGYSRQDIQLSASPALLVNGLAIGNGVEARQVMRTTDLLLARRIVSQRSSIGSLESRLTGMSQVEAFLAEPGEFGLSSLMQGMFTSLSRLASTPEDPVLRTGVVQSTMNMTAQFQQLSRNMSTLKVDTAAQVKVQTSQVNVLAQAVVHLNAEIGQVEASGVPANDLRDQREETLKQLGSLVNVSVHENQAGLVTVTVSGQLLVGQTRSYAMTAETTSDGSVTVGIQGNTAPATIKSGSLGGLIKVSQNFVPELRERLDQMAKNMIFEMNRAHSTGISQGGPFSQLTSQYAVQDTDGEVTDQLLRNAGLPFDIRSGSLYVNVSSTTDDSFRMTRIDIDEDRTTVGDMLDELNAIPHIAASLDGFGRLQILAEAEYAFDFSRRLNPAPDAHGTFGGGAASTVTHIGGPFELADGNTLDLTGPVSSFSITFTAPQFAAIDRATPTELAAAINADPGMATNALRAVVVDDRVAIQSLSAGATETFTIAGGSALAALGLTGGSVLSGSSQSVGVRITGDYLGTENGRYSFRPNMDGTIGTTPGLQVDVYDQSGHRVAALDVGAGYQPGNDLAIANGLRVSFGFGTVSATDGDVFALDTIADSDSSDILAAVGLNSMLVGTDSSDIALRDDIRIDPRRLASSVSGADGDNRALLDLMDNQSKDMDGLDGASLGEFYGNMVSGIGFDISSATNASETEQFLLDNLNARREAVSGVNTDEELVRMVQFEQAYSTAARYLQVLNSVNDELMNII